jgi:PIN domain nuclease of toxin-antitoxin system
VRLLLDTHAFLWFITDDPQLSPNAKALIADPANEIFVSPATLWEVAIKVSIGKYPIAVPYQTLISNGIEDNAFEILPIEPEHAAILTTMPFHHRDPFDRMLIAQGQVENMPIVSADLALDRYGITRLW